MAHIPLIHGPDGAKLSKRHGALGVDAYRAMGYLPAALRNYLVRLGWSQGDREFFSTEDLIAAFDLPAIGRSPSRFDFVKLENMNGHFMRATPDAELLASADRRPALSARRPRGRGQARRRQARPARERAARPEGARQDARRASRRRRLSVRRTAAGDGRKGRGDPGARREAAPGGAAAAPGGDRGLERGRDRGGCARLAAGKAPNSAPSPSRCAPPLTGRATSPGIFDVLAVLGREESLGRLRDQARAS